VLKHVTLTTSKYYCRSGDEMLPGSAHAWTRTDILWVLHLFSSKYANFAVP